MNKINSTLYLLFFTTIMFSQVYDIKDLGAKGDGKTDDTKVIQDAINRASREKAKLIFSAGIYSTGMIHLKSNVEIEILQGATWKAIPNLSLFPEIKSNADLSQKGGYTMSRRAFIWGDDVKNVSIYGHGTIYPSGDQHEAFPMKEENGAKRPYGIYFRNSKNIVIKDLHLRNSAFWMLRFYLCTDIRVQGVDLYNHANTNNDGIDIVDCHRVVVSDCVIDSSDDALCFKTEAPFGTEDVVVTNCILSSTASALKLGTGSFGTFKRMVMSNIVIRPTRAEKIIHNLKVEKGIDGIAVMSVDGADIEDIRFSNISIKGVLAPIFVRLNQRHKVTHSEYKNVKITPGTIDGIHFSDISATDCGPIASNIAGYPNHPVENITFRNINISLSKTGTSADINKEVPENDRGYPNAMMYGTNLPVFGLYFRHAKNIILDNINLIPAIGETRKPIYFEDVETVLIDNLYQNFKPISASDIIQNKVVGFKITD
ncbi:hypothetical protein J8281_11825 [Aquimarina sp. U1-2]|uniref:glycoside hydrolase family 28 protein n=1 Tax=Aquimarina sp. U1-2 TaxID=2823141 RepID=UPI001AEC9FE6|nr:glycosyl hydrolase family 28 protein [Aquimarina sp. U1-2]MBP2832874.1 hypothetical protein [Aquimarina sp. U1-2]